MKDLEYEVMPSEEAVGRAMLDEIKSAVAAKDGSLVMVLVGGRGGQALHRLLGAMAKTSDHDELFSRLRRFHAGCAGAFANGQWFEFCARFRATAR